MPDWLKDYWPMIAFMLTVAGIPMFTAWIRSGLVTRADFDKAVAAEEKSREAADKLIGSQIEETTRRVDRIEIDMRHLPDKEVTHRMELTLAALKMEISVLSERLHPVASIADRLQEFMIEKGVR